MALVNMVTALNRRWPTCRGGSVVVSWERTWARTAGLRVTDGCSPARRERVIDTPLAEAAIAGMAIGMHDGCDRWRDTFMGFSYLS
jgi:pyruvate/2-oxoglutarate/acetoin dehydrogenase E1 component